MSSDEAYFISYTQKKFIFHCDSRCWADVKTENRIEFWCVVPELCPPPPAVAMLDVDDFVWTLPGSFGQFGVWGESGYDGIP